jgi:hypothetical protein
MVHGTYNAKKKVSYFYCFIFAVCMSKFVSGLSYSSTNIYLYFHCVMG